MKKSPPTQNKRCGEKLLLEQYQGTGKLSYTIQRSKPEEAVRKAVDLISQSQVPLDAVLFDLSGTVNSIGNLRSILNMGMKCVT